MCLLKPFKNLYIISLQECIKSSMLHKGEIDYTHILPHTVKNRLRTHQALPKCV